MISNVNNGLSPSNLSASCWFIIYVAVCYFNMTLYASILLLLLIYIYIYICSIYASNIHNIHIYIYIYIYIYI